MKSRARPGSSLSKRNQQRFADAVRAHQAGRLDDAQQAYQRVLDSQPGHAGALHYMGLIHHQRGALAEAVALLQRAATSPEADASLFNNLGNLLREASQPEQAIEAYHACLGLDPAHTNARFNLATTLLGAGRAAESVPVLEGLVDAASDDPVVWSTYAHALLDCARDTEAAEAFRKASALRPGEPGHRLDLVEALSRAHAIEEALAEARRAQVDFPGELKVERALGSACMNMAHYSDALQALRPVLDAASRDVEVRSWLVRCLVERGRAAEAVRLADEGLALEPECATLLLDKGTALIRDARAAEALEYLNRAHALQPAWVEPVNNLGMAHADLGDMAQAEAQFRKVLVMDPRTPEAWFHLARSRSSESVSESDVALLEELVNDETIAPERRVPLHFALAQVMDRRREYARAFSYYARANELKRRLGRFDGARFERWVQGFRQIFTAEFMDRFKGVGNPSERPVFVLGMPRSGTTLVEQILASHPQVFGGDELTVVSELARSLVPPGGEEGDYPAVARGLTPGQISDFASEYLERIAMLDESAERITDKMPSNHFHIGLIGIMFPNSRILHCTRDGMDLCFSNFIQLFASAHFYSYNLSDIAQYYREYMRLMEHWKRLLPGRIFDVSYESLLSDQERVSRAMIAELGLDWDDACLRFYETRRVVSTASHWQVRQPIYTSARARWRNYAPYLGELMQAIGYRDGAV